MDIQETENKGAASPGKGSTAPVVGRFIPGGRKESTSDRAKGRMAVLAVKSFSVCWRRN